MTPGDHAVSFVGVTKRFGDVVALDDVSLYVAEGEFVSLLGPSGCGKTTLLRIIAGLETASRGQVLLNGSDVTHRPPQARRVGFTFQQYALFPHLTIRENVEFGLRVTGVRAQERRKRSTELLELVRVQNLADRRPDEVSGGQAQRVALARALAPDPTVLLLDEPLSALDLSVRTAMQEELRQMHREVGKTFIYVTHDQGEALAMSDRVMLMSDGRVVQDDEPTELYTRPATLFAAQFVGESNVWMATVAALNGRERCEVSLGSSATLAGRTREALAVGDEVAYVVRPECLRFSGRAEEPGRHSLEGLVDDVIVRGSDAAVLLRLQDERPVRVKVPVADADRFAPGERLNVTWDVDDAMVFKRDRGSSS